MAATLCNLLDLEIATDQKRAVRVSTQPHIVIYPHDSDLVYGEERGTDALDIYNKDTFAGLTALSWSKVLGRASGQWTIKVKEPPKKRIDLFRGAALPGDWVEIEIERNGRAIPICAGPLDSIREEASTAGGATVRAFTIAGRDHGALFEAPLVYQNPFIMTLQEKIGGIFAARVNTKIGGTPSEMFSVLIDAVFTKRSETSSAWYMPPSFPAPSGYKKRNQEDARTLEEMYLAAQPLRFCDVLNVFKGATRGGCYNQMQLWTNPGGNLHQTLGMWCNPLLNEFIYDVIYDEFSKNYNIKLGATIRERPFPFVNRELDFQFDIMSGDQHPWFYLPTWDVPSWLIESHDLGIAGHERCNIVQLLSTNQSVFGTTSDQFKTYPPSWCPDSIQRHGLAAMLETTPFLANENTGEGAWKEERAHWQNLLLEWHCLNPYMRQGSINLGLMVPEIRIGHRLRVHWPTATETFYVEGVDHHWQAAQSTAPASGRSSLMVTRGWRGSDDNLLGAIRAAVNKYEKIKL